MRSCGRWRRVARAPGRRRRSDGAVLKSGGSMPWLFGILGLLIGAAIGEFWGAVAFAVAGALLGNWLTREGGGRSDAQTHASTGAEELRQQVLSLTRRVAQLEAQMAALAPAEAAAAPSAPAPAPP